MMRGPWRRVLRRASEADASRCQGRTMVPVRADLHRGVPFTHNAVKDVLMRHYTTP